MVYNSRMMKRLFSKKCKNNVERPSIEVVIAPRQSRHSYHTGEFEQPITATPHREMHGRNLDRVVGYSPMDEKTRGLYDAVRALHAGITNVSIEPYALKVDGPEHRKKERDISDWPKSLDAQVVGCIARHLGLTDAPFRVRYQDEFEARAAADDIIAKAVIEEGVTPPEGWLS